MTTIEQPNLTVVIGDYGLRNHIMEAAATQFMLGDSVVAFRVWSGFVGRVFVDTVGVSEGLTHMDMRKVLRIAYRAILVSSPPCVSPGFALLSGETAEFPLFIESVMVSVK